MAGNLADVITCAKFQDEIFRGYDFTGGRISHFLIDFRMGLTTVQRDCAACDVGITQVNHNHSISFNRYVKKLCSLKRLLTTTSATCRSKTANITKR